MTTIREARWPGDVETVRALFREYIASIGADISFQDVDAELAALPGKYAAPDGAVFLACTQDACIGIAAFRNFDAATCEMKRMYVRPGHRGQRVGEQLANAVIDAARVRGYTRMLLDTLASMRPAIALYRSLGFEEVPAYYDNPLPGATYMAMRL